MKLLREEKRGKSKKRGRLQAQWCDENYMCVGFVPGLGVSLVGCMWKRYVDGIGMCLGPAAISAWRIVNCEFDSTRVNMWKEMGGE